jgi:hypothetical protein
VSDFNALLQELDGAGDKKNTYKARIHALQTSGQDTSRIEKGVLDVKAVLNSGTRRFVIYGEPQSGKTEFMIALTCHLVDSGFRTIFVVMNDNTELEEQNYDRFRGADELDPTPIRDYQVANFSEAELKREATRIIFCRKNSKNLQKLIPLCRHMTNRFVIDDEADYATPNTKINQSEITAINKYLGELGHLHVGGDGFYAGVTATPGRLDLNNTYANESEKWVFLQSYPSYRGRKFFFPQSASEVSESSYQLVRLPDQTDEPKLLREAVFRFLGRTAILNLRHSGQRLAYSMLVHTAGKVRDHEEDEKAISNIFTILSSKDDTRRVKYWERIYEIVNQLVKKHSLDLKSDAIFSFVYQHIGQREILTINSENDTHNMSKAGSPKALFTFAIGGNIVSRGVTFERLLTFYFSRSVKGRYQQNTYIQRARMFGNRPYSEFFELCVPEKLFEDWAQLFQDHELSLRLAMAGSYAHLESGRNQVADASAIDRGNVEVSKREHTVGDIFDASPELIQALTSCPRGTVLSLFKELIRLNILPLGAIKPEFLSYVEETSEGEQSFVLLVLRHERSSPNGFIQNIDRYSDGDGETLLRARGGIIHAMLNKSPDYDSHRHFFLPIMNTETRKIRFLYKSNLGHKIYRNLVRS